MSVHGTTMCRKVCQQRHPFAWAGRHPIPTIRVKLSNPRGHQLFCRLPPCPWLLPPPAPWLLTPGPCHPPPPPGQGPRVVEAYFSSGPVGGQVREVVLYTLSLGSLQQPVARLELLVQPAGTSTKGGRRAKVSTSRFGACRRMVYSGITQR